MSGRIRSLGSTFLAAAALAAPAAAAPAPPAIVTGQDAGWPEVRGFDRFGAPAFGSAPWGSWQLAFSPYSTYQKGVRVAVGDVDGDGRAEIVTAPADRRSRSSGSSTAGRSRRRPRCCRSGTPRG